LVIGGRQADFIFEISGKGKLQQRNTEDTENGREVTENGGTRS